MQSGNVFLNQTENFWSWIHQYFVNDMVQPTESFDGEEDDIVLGFALLTLIGLLYSLHRYYASFHSNKDRTSEIYIRSAEDNFRAEILAYLDSISPGPSFRIMPESIPPPSRYKYHDCAVCLASAGTHCSRCSSVIYCSYECQIIDWRAGHKETCKQQLRLATGASEHVPFLRNMHSPYRGVGKHYACSDAKNGHCDVLAYSINREQHGTGDMISSCIKTNASGPEPVQRSVSSIVATEYEALEQLLIDETAKPIMLSYSILNDITNNFSEVIGHGGSGEVYMGLLGNHKVAVKKLYNMELFTDKQFADELKCLIRVKHNNIVRLLGYCSDTQQKVVEHNGQFVLADIRRRFLCIEYAPNKSLDDYLKDESHGHKRETRYQMILGICKGLLYFHNKESITHLDIKPGNVLLDANMVPKITDFGISRRFSGAESRIITKHFCGSLGYMAPELVDKGEISFKSDIYSLGVIIKSILSGSADPSDSEKWHHVLGTDCPQVKTCIKIAQLYVDEDPDKRPTIDCIIDMLNNGSDEISYV